MPTDAPFMAGREPPIKNCEASERSTPASENTFAPLPLHRRPFGMYAASVGTAGPIQGISQPLPVIERSTNSRPEDDARYVVEARFYEKLSNGKVKCKLCPRECTVRDGARGYCGARENRGGTFYTLVHSRVCAAHVDPVEKKPFFHYLPGTSAFSIATAGCNVNCKFCQNWDIAQASPEQVPAEYLPPRQIAALAAQYRCPTIAYTYSEPIVFSEFLMDTADVAHDLGIRSIAISNGYIHEEARPSVYGKMDAVKIDLKSFSDRYYQKVVTGELKPVLDTIVALREMGKWTEIVYLVVPALNDSDREFRSLAHWVKTNVGEDVPLHFSQFHPEYLFNNLAVTPVSTLERAKSIADAVGLHYVYIGNVPGHPAENTYCPRCGQLLVERAGFEIRQMLIRQGACPSCKHTIPGIWHL
jgi:pyruvate formate lyase activating enzyme